MALGEVRMNSDFRVSVDFFAHHKTKKLRRRLGYEGVVALLQLWAYAARVRPDGDLSGMEDEDIELAVDWCGEEGTLVPTLKSVGFLDEDEGGLRLHDWQENNAWAAAGESRSDASRLSRMAKVFPDEYQALVGAGIRGVSKRDYEALRTSNDRWVVIDGMIRGCRRAGGDAQGADNDQTTVVNEARTVVERPLTTVERPFDDDLSPAPAPSPAPMAINNTPLTPHGGEGRTRKRASGPDSLPALTEGIEAYTEDDGLREALGAYVAMRQKIRKPLTGQGLRLSLRELDRLAGDDVAQKIAIVEQSVQRSWQGLFALKPDSGGGQKDSGDDLLALMEASRKEAREAAERRARENSPWGRVAQ